MADQNNGDVIEEVTQGERRRRQKKVLPKPLLRLLVVLAVVIVVVVVVVVVVTSAMETSEAADYQRYMTSVADMLEQSDAIGGELAKLLTDPGDTSRKDIQTRLDQFVAKSAQLETQAKELEVPKELLADNVHQFLVLVMTFRNTGLADLEPSLMNALEVQDTDVAAEQIARALSYLTNSDFLYKEVFAPKVTEIVKQKELTGVTVPDSQFLSDPDLASRARAQEIIATLKSTGNLQAVHGVAIAKVVAQPDEQEINDGKTYNLTASDALAFLVTVENQGNMAEKDVPVVVTLGTASGEPQKITVTIPELKPGTETTVKVEGLNPTAYGEVATLTVEAGPVAEEKFRDNNSIKASVIFKL
jgi:CARDB